MEFHAVTDDDPGDLYYIYAQPVVRARSLARITAIEQQEHLCFDISNFRLNYRPIDRRTSLTKAVVDVWSDSNKRSNLKN